MATDTTHEEGPALSSNVAQGADASQGRWLDRPITLPIDPGQLESGGAMDPAFKRIAAVESEESKRQDGPVERAEQLGQPLAPFDGHPAVDVTAISMYCLESYSTTCQGGEPPETP